jgi:hypothetical protein
MGSVYTYDGMGQPPIASIFCPLNLIGFFVRSGPPTGLKSEDSQVPKGKAPGAASSVVTLAFHPRHPGQPPAWPVFARMGKPNEPGLAEWLPFVSKYQPTVVFDANSHAVTDLIRDVCLLLERASQVSAGN